MLSGSCEAPVLGRISIEWPELKEKHDALRARLLNHKAGGRLDTYEQYAYQVFIDHRLIERAVSSIDGSSSS